MPSVGGSFGARVEERLTEAVRGADTLARAQAHLVTAPASKRLRPRALALFADLIGEPIDDGSADALVADATAVELIHTASLLHDDVVDHARVRRGRPSANAIFTDGVALLAGDALLARALSLCSPRVLPKAVDVIQAMARAALLEVELRGRADASVTDVLAIVDGKTAALFSLCGFAAGVRRDAECAARLADAGQALGRAFQIRDDVDDLLRVDPERGNDVVERTPTLPLALLRELDAPLSHALAELWARPTADRGDVMSLVQRIAASAASARALEVAAAHVRTLEDRLAPFAHRPGHATLIGVARGLVEDPTPARAPRDTRVRGAA